MISILKLSLIIQIVEDPQTQISSEYFDNMFVIICSVLVIVIIMLIPAIFSFSALDHFIKLQKIDGKFDKINCTENSVYSSKDVDCICKKYLKSYAAFTKYLSSIIAWNLLSLIYILSVFPDFITGLETYFALPFNTIGAIYSESFASAFNQYAASWYYMIAITILSFIFLFAGKIIGAYLGKASIQKRKFEFVADL